MAQLSSYLQLKLLEYIAVNTTMLGVHGYLIYEQRRYHAGK